MSVLNTLKKLFTSDTNDMSNSADLSNIIRPKAQELNNDKVQDTELTPLNNLTIGIDNDESDEFVIMSNGKVGYGLPPTTRFNIYNKEEE